MLTPLKMLVARMRGILSRQREDEEFSDELREHLDLLTEENVRRGMPLAEARREAKIRLGGATQLRETHRELTGIPFLETLFQDVRYALRMLRKNPGFTAVAVLTLALGIGANTAIFSVIDAVLLRSLPYPNLDRLVGMNESLPRAAQMPVSMPDFLDWQKQNDCFEQIAAYAPDSFTLMTPGGPVVLRSGFVSWSFFSLLGVKPILGRTFGEAEDQPGAHWTGGVVISYSLWRNELNGDPKIIGKTITFKGGVGQVIGVLPPGFQFPDLRADVYNPIGPLAHLPNYADRSNHPGIQVLARLRPGVSLDAARADMATIMNRLGMEYPKSNRGERVNITPLYTLYLSGIQPMLLTLFGAAGFVLLLACANVANLFLARATTRQKEMALRAAIGATRARLLRQLFTESLLLSLLGAGAGVLFAFWMMKPLLALTPRSIPNISNVALNTTVLLFTLGAAVFTGVLFGLAPSVQATRLDLNRALKDNAGAVAASARQAFRSILLVAEISVAMVLVIGSGLLIRSLSAELRVNPGFSPEHLLALDVFVSGQKVSEAYDLNFYGDALRRIRALPRVQSAAAVMQPPIAGLHWTSPYKIDGQPSEPPSEWPWTAINMVTLDYFQTMQTPLLEGRFFTDADNAHAPLVAIINDTLARKLWPNGSAVGKRIYAQQAWRQIVGVVHDLKQYNPAAPTWPETFIPFEQMPLNFMTIVIRTIGNPAALARSATDAIHSIDKDPTVSGVAPMTEYIAKSVESRRFSTYLLSLLGLLALLLAAIGTYGVMAYSVAQRTHEVGVRMALGAVPTDVLSLIIGRGAKLALAGIAIGIIGALALTRLIASQLFGVTSRDPLTFSSVAILLFGISLLACYIPARRAMKVDPMVALRYE
ncbi:MAG: ABC transporter permease [Candidatus Acidiferrales bacterium]